MFVVTINPHTPIGRYYGAHLVAEGDSYEINDDYLVVFASTEAGEDAKRRSVLIVPVADLLAIDEV